MRSNKYSISTCVCPDCGNNMFVPRRGGSTRKKGHIKDIWCPYCGEVKQMKEIRSRDYCRNMLGEYY